MGYTQLALKGEQISECIIVSRFFSKIHWLFYDMWTILGSCNIHYIFPFPLQEQTLHSDTKSIWKINLFVVIKLWLNFLSVSFQFSLWLKLMHMLGHPPVLFFSALRRQSVDSRHGGFFIRHELSRMDRQKVMHKSPPCIIIIYNPQHLD